MRSAVRWFWFAAAVVVLWPDWRAQVFLIREHLAVERDAQAVRDALAAGRPAWALIRSAAGCAPALLGRSPRLKAEVALAEGDFPEVKREFNKARALGLSDEEKLDRIRAIWLARLGRFAEAEPILTRLWTWLTKDRPRRR